MCKRMKYLFGEHISGGENEFRNIRKITNIRKDGKYGRDQLSYFYFFQ